MSARDYRAELTAYALYTGMLVRLERAREHLADLKRRLESLREVDFNRVIDEGESEIIYVHELEILKNERYPMLPHDKSILMISVIIGEVIHNLRSSLDYLIYGLAWNDS